MAETLIEVFRIACYDIDTNEFQGYMSNDGDITIDEHNIKYYGTYKEAGNDIDTQDEQSTGIKKSIEPVMMGLEEFMTEH